MVCNWILAPGIPEPILEAAGGTDYGRQVIQSPSRGPLEYARSSGDRGSGASCRRSPSQTFTLPSLELSDWKDPGLLPADNHPHCSRVLRLGGLFPNSWDCLDSKHRAPGVEEGKPYLWLCPLYVLSRPCSQEMLLGPDLLQSVLFLTAPGTSGTYQLTGYYVSIIVAGEEFQKPALFRPCYLLQPHVPGADSEHRTHPP